jgi:hypothetical protein
MQFSLKALLVFAAFVAMVVLTLSLPGSGWVYLADGVTSVIIVLSLAGFLTTHSTRRSP